MGKITHQKTYSKIYRTWIAMLSRCRDRNSNNYKNYGARGITVCERWHKFENFYEDMGDLPFYEAQIDRIDNEKGYYKENCRWVNHKQNSRNRRSTKVLHTHMGKLVQIELMEKIGWNRDQFRWFLKRYGIAWILEGFKNGTLPKRTNFCIHVSDIVNKKFGKWTVLSFVSYAKKTGHIYLCKCDCGTERKIPRHNLTAHKSTRCRKCAAINHWRRK
jgi:hypothetical protein